MSNNEAIYRELWMIAPFFKWMDRHPTLSNVLLYIEALAAMYAVFNYHFTTYL